MARIVVDLKAEIERIREQIQNISSHLAFPTT